MSLQNIALHDCQNGSRENKLARHGTQELPSQIIQAQRFPEIPLQNLKSQNNKFSIFCFLPLQICQFFSQRLSWKQIPCGDSVWLFFCCSCLVTGKAPLKWHRSENSPQHSSEPLGGLGFRWAWIRQRHFPGPSWLFSSRRNPSPKHSQSLVFGT